MLRIKDQRLENALARKMTINAPSVKNEKSLIVMFIPFTSIFIFDDTSSLCDLY
ncbi:hypothetical protein BN136_35 [Cronobacter universalis NCTC 9529]|nr:hypothetical protein BN136_35 [Cronobacter universalis NCTC 9529]